MRNVGGRAAVAQQAELDQHRRVQYHDSRALSLTIQSVSPGRSSIDDVEEDGDATTVAVTVATTATATAAPASTSASASASASPIHLIDLDAASVQLRPTAQLHWRSPIGLSRSIELDLLRSAQLHHTALTQTQMQSQSHSSKYKYKYTAHSRSLSQVRYHLAKPPLLMGLVQLQRLCSNARRDTNGNGNTNGSGIRTRTQTTRASVASMVRARSIGSTYAGAEERSRRYFRTLAAVARPLKFDANGSGSDSVVQDQARTGAGQNNPAVAVIRRTEAVSGSGSNLAGAAKRRESFLYREDPTNREARVRRSSANSQPLVAAHDVANATNNNVSPQATAATDDKASQPPITNTNTTTTTTEMRLLDEPIVTPFAQILATLHNVRAKYTAIAHLPQKRLSKFRNVHSSIEENANENQLDANESESIADRAVASQRQAAADVLEDLDWCLDQLETVQSHRSLSDLASSKFKRLLKKELSQLTEAGQTGSQVADYISNTYTDKQQEDIETSSPNAEDAARLKTNGTGFRNNAAVKRDAQPASEEVTDVLITAPVVDGATHMSLIATVESGTGALVNNATSGPTSEDVKNQNAFVKPFVGRVTTSADAIKCCRLVNGKPRFSTWTDDDVRKIDDVMKSVNEWGIDLFRVHSLTGGHPLVTMTFSVLESRNLLARLKINPLVLLKYLVVVEAQYHEDIPYHTSTHAADVTQSTHVMLSASRFQNVFSDLEVFAAIMASAIHDTDHPGVTNQFLINTSSDLATMYNDESVLENHHLAVSFKIMQEADLDFLHGHTAKVRSQFRRLLIDMVLATDMSKHMALLADLKTMVESKIVSQQNSEAETLTLETYSDKILIMKNLIHCADLSNPAKPLPIYQVWVSRIMEEFFRQGDLERSKGIDISPMCDRLTATVEKSQVGFIDFIVHPLWETWAELVYPDCQPMLDLLAENREWYKQRAA